MDIPDIFKKWDLGKTHGHWVFTKSEADQRYKQAITASKRLASGTGRSSEYRNSLGVSSISLGGKPFYGVSFFMNSDKSPRFQFTKDLWEYYGYLVHGHDGGIYVRRKQGKNLGNFNKGPDITVLYSNKKDRYTNAGRAYAKEERTRIRNILKNRKE